MLATVNAIDAQDIQTRLPAFQAPASDNLEAEMMRRISLSGALQPGDLARLSRLAVLNSISMLVNVRADIANSPRAFELEQELSSLWNSSEAFYEVVTEAPIDADSVGEAQYWLDAMSASQRNLQASLGVMPGFSARAAERLRAFSRLMVPIGSAMESIEADMTVTADRSPPRAIDLDAMRRDGQVVANALVALIRDAGDAGRGRAGRDAVMTELTDLLERVQSFSRLLAIQPSQKAIEDSFRAARRQMWRVQGRVNRVEWKPALERPWREVREQLHAISNKLGLPRVIEVAPSARPLTNQERAMAAHVDHAIAWLDEFIAVSGPRLRKTDDGSRFITDAIGLRNKILNLRRRAIAGDPPERLALMLKVIVELNEGLADRAATLPVDPSNTSVSAQFRNSAEAVRKIDAVVAKG
jgi:hypothetical protein